MGSMGRYAAISISIHTTAKVVTEIRRQALIHKIHFNPHHREGGDSDLRRADPGQEYFNPHHREGGDQRSKWRQIR